MSDKKDQPQQPPTPQAPPFGSEAAKPQPAETVFYGPDAGTSPDDLQFEAPTVSPTAPPPLGHIAHYEVQERLGQGGMGVVLRARDPKLRRSVAIKVLAPHLASDAAARRRFLREAQAAAAVSHPNVVTIFAVDDQDPPYLVMECVVGESLDDRLQRVGPLPVEEVVRIGTQIAEGLAAAHAQGLIHRDIKPANILLEHGSDRVKITDFGLARAATDASATQSGLIAGTPQFMSPEQAEGETLDPRSDLFSLGSVLYAMSTGQTPFAAETLMGVLRKVCNAQPTPIRTLQPNHPVWLSNVIAKLMAKSPNDRFASAAEVVSALQRRQSGAAPATAPAAPRSPRVALLFLAAVCLIGVGVAVVAATMGDRSRTDALAERPGVQSSQTVDNHDLAQPSWTSLADPSLTAWHVPLGNGIYKVVDQDLVAEIEKDSISFMETKRNDYRDFEIAADVRIEQGTVTALMMRLAQGARGYNLGIVRAKSKVRIGSLQRVVEKLGNDDYQNIPGQHEIIVPADEWAKLQVTARGNTLLTKINGQLISHCTDETYSAGRIALAISSFGTERTRVCWRNLRIKEFDPSAPFVPPPVPDEPPPYGAASKHQQAAAKQLGLPVELTNSLGMKLRLIPAGKFTMGSTVEQLEIVKQASPPAAWNIDRVNSEAPPRQVVIDKAFYMAETKVTQEQFAQFVKATNFKTAVEVDQLGGEKWNLKTNALERSPELIWNDKQFTPSEDCPVPFVTGADAEAFCVWLTKQDGCEYRLPTEEQWEYACRAGTDTFWHWGNDPDEYKIFEWNDGGRHPVGLLPANPFGLFDIHRNGYEIASSSDGYRYRSGSQGFDIWTSRSASRRPEPAIPEAQSSFRVAIVGDLTKVTKRSADTK